MHHFAADPSPNAMPSFIVPTSSPVASISNSEVWSSAMVRLLEAGVESSPPEATITSQRLNSHFSFVQAFSSIASLNLAFPRRRESYFLVTPLNLRHLVISYHFFTVKQMHSILSALGIHVGLNMKKDRLLQLLKECASSTELLFLFEAKSQRRRTVTAAALASTNLSNLSRKRKERSTQDPSVSRTQREKNAEAHRQRYAANVVAKREVAADAIRATQDAFPEICPPARREDIIRRFQAEIHPSQFNSKACAVCQRKCTAEDIDVVPPDMIDFSVLRNPRIPKDLLPNEYPSDLYDGAILYPPGMHSLTSKGSVDMCVACAKALLSPKPHLPEFALANGYYFAIPRLPSHVQKAFCTASPVDLLLVSLAKAIKIMHRYTENPESPLFRRDPETSQRYNKGNTILLPQDPGGVRSCLPPTAEEINAAFCVLFVGRTKPTKENIKRLSPSLASKSIVSILLDFLLPNNPHYARSGVTFSQENLDRLFGDGDQGNDTAIPCAATIDTLELDEAVRSGTTDYTDRYDDIDDIETRNSDDPARILMEPVAYTEGDHSPQNLLDMKVKALSRVINGRPYLKSQSSSRPLSEWDNDFLSAVWPHLDPWGIGGLNYSGRENKTSLFRQVQHLLQLDRSPFESDPTFAFVCWNIIQKAEVNQTTNFRVSDRERTSLVRDIWKLDPDLLDQISAKWALNPAAKATTANEKAAVRILRKLRHVGGSLKGSAAQKQTLRNEIRGMMNVLGTPALFITLNPADVHHPLVRVLAGSDDAAIDHVTSGLRMSKLDRARVVSDHPAAGAKFFHVMISAFLKCILGSNGAPGLFGTSKGYYGTVEAQGKGTLHLHLLVWLEGNLNPQALRDRMAADKTYENDMFAWLESNILTALPDATGVVVGDAAKKPQYPKDSIDPRAVWPPQIADLPLDEFYTRYKSYLKDLIPKCNFHKHSDTCWKHLKKSMARSDANCRMGIDGSTRPETKVDKDSGCILLRRWHPRINNYNAVVMFLMQCNMDIKYIGSGEASKALIFYITDYITKNGLPVHVGLAAIASAIRKAQVPPDGEHTANDRALLTKCINAMMARLEISHQQVMSYFVGGGDHYTSHSFRSLFWGDLDRYLKKEDPDANSSVVVPALEEGEEPTVEQKSSTDPQVVLHLGKRSVTASNQMYDYLYRPSDMEFDSLCLWDLVATTEKIPQSEETRRELAVAGKARPRGRKPLPRGSFSSPEHPQYESHLLRRRSAVVPVLLGPTIPRADRYAAEYELWCRAMLILFKPWRSAADLKDSGQSWTDAFEQHTFDARLVSIMHNINVQHECKDARDNYSEMRRAGRIKDTWMPGLEDARIVEQGDLEDALLGDADLDGASDYGDDDNDSPFEKRSRSSFDKDVENAMLLLQRAQANSESHADTSLPTPNAVPPHCRSFTEVDENDLAQIHVHSTFMSDLKKFGKPSMNKIDETPSNGFTNSVQGAEASIEHLGSMTAIHHTITTGGSGEATDPLEEVERIAQKYGLRENAEQNRAFRLIAEHLLTGNLEQLLMYLGGVGGTGKSHVINAVLELFRSCGFADSLLISAPTGIAAVLIDGYTIHSLTLLPKSVHKKDPQKLEDIWRSVRWLVIDEISMISSMLLSEISHQISIAKGSDPTVGDKPFGGVNVLFAGDFGQLRPVKAKSLFSYDLVKSITLNTAQSSLGQSNLHGACIWRGVTKHVELKKSWRHHTDPKYSNLLGRVRYGRAWQGLTNRFPDQIGTGTNYAAPDYDVLLGRVIENVSRVSGALTPFREAPFIVTSRSVRDPLNTLRTLQYAERTGQEVQDFHAVDRTGKRPVGEVEGERLARLSSTVTKDALPVLSLVPGMKVMITENIAVARSVVNGAEGTLVDVKYHLDAKGRKLPSCAYVHIPGSRIHIEGLRPDIVPIVPTVTRFPYNSPSGGTFPISRLQLPLLPAYAFTDYKSQGRTLECAIVDLTDANSLQSIYVMLSRVKSLSGLLILRWFKPTKMYQRLQQEFRDEFERLARLHQHTEVAFSTRIPTRLEDVHPLVWESYRAHKAKQREMVL